MIQGSIRGGKGDLVATYTVNNTLIKKLISVGKGEFWFWCYSHHWEQRPSLIVLFIIYCIYLDKGSDACNDSKSQNYNFCSIVNPKHFSSELLAIFHHEKDDDNYDSTNKT